MAERQTSVRPRVGIVLGAGGVLGGAWMTGALAALEQVSGWDPRSADHLVGTSAGAVFAALLAGGVAPAQLLPPSMDGTRGSWLLADLVRESTYRAPGSLLRRPFGSPGLALSAISRPHRGQSLLQVLGGLVPPGRVPAEPIARTIRHVIDHGWASHPSCRIVATDYANGRRVVFDGLGARGGNIAEAVAASCAIPGLFEPVVLNGRRYVDGGLGSLCNLDLMEGQDLDIVICFSAMTARAAVLGGGIVNRAVRFLLRSAAEQLRHEVRRLTESGVEVIVVEPTARDRAAMGADMMQARRWATVLETALRSVRTQLRRRAAIARLGLVGSAA